MNKHRLSQGMTLVELLIGLLITGILLEIMLTMFSSNTKLAAQYNSRSDMQQDTLLAQQLITGRLREAYYIWPAGQTINLSSSQAGSPSAKTYQNPLTGSGIWTTGTQPILAMLAPPKDASSSCTGNDCLYAFYAYYPVKRSVWVSGTSGSNNPGPDSVNGYTWILVQYKGYMNSSYNAVASNSATTVPDLASYLTFSTANAQPLADYIAPSVGGSRTYTMFTLQNAANPTQTTSTTLPVDTVTVTLASARQVGGQQLRLPSASSEYSLTVNASNQGKIPSP